MNEKLTTVKAEHVSSLRKLRKDSGKTLSVLCVRSEFCVNQWLMFYAFRTGTRIAFLPFFSFVTGASALIMW